MVDFTGRRLAAGARQFMQMRALRRFVRRQDGGTAIEFSLIALPFLSLVFAIMETALVFFAGQALETAVADSSRLIMTGEAQKQGFNQAAFKEAVCAKVYGLFDCASGVSVDVKSYTSFPPSLPSPIDANGNFVSNFAYDPGGPSSIVVVRLFYQWPLALSMVGLSNMANGKRLLVATAAFRNEPYAN